MIEAVLIVLFWVVVAAVALLRAQIKSLERRVEYLEDATNRPKPHERRDPPPGYK